MEKAGPRTGLFLVRNRSTKIRTAQEEAAVAADELALLVFQGGRAGGTGAHDFGAGPGSRFFLWRANARGNTRIRASWVAHSETMPDNAVDYKRGVHLEQSPVASHQC
jgi:hypothetical protein